ncbi:hypothetical protein PMAYCL1PPCAC_16138, partial [Pristionchus mayeri]
SRVERTRSLHSALKSDQRTCGEKKVVHFADAMGFDLVQEKILLYSSSEDDLLSTSPSIPFIRPASWSALTSTCDRGGECESRCLLLHTPLLNSSKEKPQDVLQRTLKNGVCLKSHNVIGMTFTAIVAVCARYSLDGWKSFKQTQARYIFSNRRITRTSSHSRCSFPAP